MKSYQIFLVILIPMIYWGCCPDSVFPFEDGICQNEVFRESRVVPLKFTYTVNTDKKFLEATTLTAHKIQQALNVEGSNFTVNKIDLTSASLAYLKHEDNTSAAVFVNLAIVDNDPDLPLVLLMKKDELLPLFDIPATLLTPEININKFLNGKGVEELTKILKTYAGSLNEEGLSFILLGEGSPQGTTTHFEINVTMQLSIEYEVCRFVPLGKGLRVCDL